MLPPVRRRLAALATVLVVPLLGACAPAGFNTNYQTDAIYQPGVGVNERSGTVDVLGAVVVSTSGGRGTFVAGLANKSLENDDTLNSITGEDVQVQVSAPVPVPAEGFVNLADTGAVSVTGESVRPGEFVRLTLEFASGQSTEVNVPVVAYEGEYSDIKPASAPSASASPSASPSP
jgi:hypothetical protein